MENILNILNILKLRGKRHKQWRKELYSYHFLLLRLLLLSSIFFQSALDKECYSQK